MYPAHMRSSKPTKRLQARQSGDDSASAVLEPQLERSVVRQDNSLSQAIPDVRWQLPPQNPALRTHKLTAEHAVMPSEGPPMRNVAAAPLTHSPTRQSRIPSPTKSTSKVFATGPTGSVHSFPLDKQVPDALQPRHTDNVQSTSLMQPAAALCPSEVCTGFTYIDISRMCFTVSRLQLVNHVRNVRTAWPHSSQSVLSLDSFECRDWDLSGRISGTNWKGLRVN